jgi:hypothetical protein
MISGRGNTGTGMFLASGVSMTPPDSAQPIPTTISQFSLGVSLQDGTLRNAIVRDNSLGIRIDGNGGTVNYCTVVRNSSHGIIYSGCYQLARVQNSIFTNNGGIGVSLCVQFGSSVDYLDSWSNASGNYSFMTLGFTPGPNRQSFNPFYVNPSANDFRLSPGSIFYTYSASGGQLGAYGPGAGLPTPNHSKSWGALKVRYR